LIYQFPERVSQGVVRLILVVCLDSSKTHLHGMSKTHQKAMSVFTPVSSHAVGQLRSCQQILSTFLGLKIEKKAMRHH